MVKDTENKESKTIKPTSKGGGGRYKYASMSDIAKNFTIPKMRIARDIEHGREWIQWLDEELNEWLDGCDIVPIHERNLGNEAQQWGAAFSYARRYTTMMALQLVTDDDDAMEAIDHRAKAVSNDKASDAQIGKLKSLLGDSFEAVIAGNGGLENLTKNKASCLIDVIINKQSTSQSK